MAGARGQLPPSVIASTANSSTLGPTKLGTPFGSMIPADVRNWVRGAFRKVNKSVSESLSRIPTLHEPTLDMALIERLQTGAPRTQLASGWVVEVQTHFLGGLRHWREWEVADIGLLVMLREGGTLRATKSAVLQSKRLYPDEVTTPDEDDAADYQIGFARLFRDGIASPGVLAPRTLTFSAGSRYRALEFGSSQWNAMREYSEHSGGVPVHMLFYNPVRVPWKVALPVRTASLKYGSNELGCRVVPFLKLSTAMDGRKPGESPSLTDVAKIELPQAKKGEPGWRLEKFVADRLLRCFEGAYSEGSSVDERLYRLFSRRSGPIAAAFAITLDAPGGALEECRR